MKAGIRIKNYCNECHHETWHNVLFVKNISESNYDISWSKDYGILQCAGCDTVCFRIESSDSESFDVDEFGNWVPSVGIENFPPTNEDLNGIENLYEVPPEINKIYTETVKAIVDGCYKLAGIGLRATIEAICLHEGISGKDLDIKINKLVTNGFISKDDAGRLHAIRFIGNDAAHEKEVPLRGQVIIALKIIEHLVSTKYAMQEEINEYLELPINSYDEFKSLLSKKIVHCQNNVTFTLQSLIGKDKRRISKNDYPTFINQFESEIQSGIITNIEDVTAQIQDSSTKKTLKGQKIYKKKV